MKNSLADLNNILFEELDRLTDDTGDIDLSKEVVRAEKIVRVSNQIIEIGKTQLDAMRLRNEYGLNNSDMTALLVDKDSKNIKKIGDK